MQYYENSVIVVVLIMLMGYILIVVLNVVFMFITGIMVLNANILQTLNFSINITEKIIGIFRTLNYRLAK